MKICPNIAKTSVGHCVYPNCNYVHPGEAVRGCFSTSAVDGLVGERELGTGPMSRQTHYLESQYHVRPFTRGCASRSHLNMHRWQEAVLQDFGHRFPFGIFV